MYQAVAYTQLAVWKLFYSIIQLRDSSPERQREESSISLSQNYNMFVSDASCVLSTAHGSIYVGSAKNAADWYFLDTNNVQAVVNVTEEIPNFYSNHLAYHNIVIGDVEGANMGTSSIADAVAFIDDQLREGKSVLVHCFMGRSRSVAIVCAYLMTHLNMGLDDAYEQVKENRPNININNSFYDTLIDYVSDMQTVPTLFVQ